MRWTVLNIATAYLATVISPLAQGAKLNLKIEDASGRPTHARVEIKGSDDNYYIADDALIAGGDCDMSDIGAQLTDIESTLALFSKIIKNPYNNSQQFYAGGSARIELPPGEAQITVVKGSEYKIHSGKIIIGPEGDASYTAKLERWIDMRQQGWYSSDGHLHIPRPTGGLNPHISKMMQAEDIHVANLLQSGKVKNFKMAEQYAFGKPSVYGEMVTCWRLARKIFEPTFSVTPLPWGPASPCLTPSTTSSIA